MSDPDRGYGQPPPDRLSFDPREPVRSGGPAPVTLIVSGVVLVAIIGAVFLLYRGGIRHKGEGPAEVGAPIAQIKTPAQPDQGAAPAQLSVNRVEASQMPGNAAPAFAPPPEQPLPRPAPEQAPPVVATTLPRPAAVAPQAPAVAPAAHAAAPTPAHPIVAAGLPPPAAATTKPAKPVTIASLTDAAMKPAPKPPTITPPPPPPAQVATAAAPPAGAGWVQTGAYSSAPLAEQGWRDVAKLAPAGMAGKGQRVEPVAKDGKTLYRAYVTGFSTRDAAQAFCGKLKAAGHACFVK